MYFRRMRWNCLSEKNRQPCFHGVSSFGGEMFLPHDSGAVRVLHQFAGFACLFGFSAFISLSSSGVI